jgi:hypothetical protein
MVKQSRSSHRIWIRLSQAQQPDKFLWKWTSDQCFSSASAYRAFSHGQSVQYTGGEHFVQKLRRRLPAIFSSLLGRCWTSERLIERHGLPNSGPCALCGQASESIAHLLISCVFSRETWFWLLSADHPQQVTPSPDSTWPDWWLWSRKQLTVAKRKAFDTVVVLTCWCLWRERNALIFDGRF